MAFCGNCRHAAAPAPAPPTLCQIRHGYHVQWNDLALSVDSGSDDWTLRVQDSRLRETLYTARRAGVRAAQLAAAEFAIFRVLGPASQVSPERLAFELNWQQH